VLRDLSRGASKNQNWKFLRQLRRQRRYVIVTKNGHFDFAYLGNHVDSKLETGDGEKRMKDKIPFVKCDAGCGRTVAATRYAPHLEKCLGLGKSRNRR